MAITIRTSLPEDYGTQIGLRFFLVSAPAAKVGADRFLAQMTPDSVRVYSGDVTIATGLYRVELFDVSAADTIDSTAFIGELFANITADGVTLWLETAFPIVSDFALTAGTVITAIDDLLDTEVTAIKAKTDNLPSDPADQSSLEAAITAATSPLATAANLATVAGYLDTEIVAIKAKTDLIICVGINYKYTNTVGGTGFDQVTVTVP